MIGCSAQTKNRKRLLLRGSWGMDALRPGGGQKEDDMTYSRFDNWYCGALVLGLAVLVVVQTYKWLAA